MATDAQNIFGQYPPASWAVGGGRALVFPVNRITEERSNRLMKRARPYRDGNKIDDIGAQGKEWTLECHFDDSIVEPGLLSNEMPLYPDVLNALAASFEVHECGDLVVPTIGRVRARAASLTRIEESDMRDGATVTLRFSEDTEDAVNAAALKPPSVHASILQLMSTTQFDAKASGAWKGGSMSDLNGLVNELQGIANAPDTMAGEVADRARIVRHDVQALVRTFSRRGRTAVICCSTRTTAVSVASSSASKIWRPARKAIRRDGGIRYDLCATITT